MLLFSYIYCLGNKVINKEKEKQQYFISLSRTKFKFLESKFTFVCLEWKNIIKNKDSIKKWLTKYLTKINYYQNWYIFCTTLMAAQNKI